MPKREMKLLLQDIIENSAMIFQFPGTDSYQEFIDDKMKVLLHRLRCRTLEALVVGRIAFTISRLVN